MVIALLILTLIAAVGWGMAGSLWYQVRAHQAHVCLTTQGDDPSPADALQKAVLVNRAGVPESVRTLKGAPPKTFVRAHGKAASIEYRRIGTAILYQVPE